MCKFSKIIGIKRGLSKQDNLQDAHY